MPLAGHATSISRELCNKAFLEAAQVSSTLNAIPTVAPQNKVQDSRLVTTSHPECKIATAQRERESHGYVCECFADSDHHYVADILGQK